MALKSTFPGRYSGVTVIGTNALVRTVASAWKSHQHAGEELHARRLQPVNKPFSFNHLSPSFHIREAYLFTIHFYLFPAAACAPRPWGMQPNTSFRFRMCISPLMSRSNIIPFSPCPSPLLRITCAKTGLTFFLTISLCENKSVQSSLGPIPLGPAQAGSSARRPDSSSSTIRPRSARTRTARSPQGTSPATSRPALN